MPELEPITREEKLLDGQDLESITRKEMFIKRIYDKTQVVPKPITREEMFLNKAGEGGGGDITIEQLNVTQNGTYSESGKAYSPVVVNVPAPPIPENAYLLNDLSGLPANIASFTDGTDLPMASLKVSVTPYQDLHGYDAPWAGGAGKNKLNNIASSKTENNVTFTVNSDGSVKVYSTGATATTVLVLTDTNNPLIIQANKSYILSGCPNGGSYSTYELMLIATPTSGSALLHDYGSGVTIESSESDRVLGVQIVIRSGQVINDTFYPMVRLASVADATFAPYSNICPIIGWDEAVVTVADDAESPTTSHEYTIDLNGTRYGGELDVVNGVLTVDRAFVDLGGLSWSRGNTGITGRYRFITQSLRSTAVATPSNVVANLTTSIFITVKGDTGWSTDIDNIIWCDNYKDISVVDSSYTDATAFKTAMSGVQLVYELATPITVQLTPTQVKSLEGVNNINANCGQITEVKYFKKA